MSVKQSSGQIEQLDMEIETLREKLHRLVSANASVLSSKDAYLLSRKLDRLIAKIHEASITRS